MIRCFGHCAYLSAVLAGLIFLGYNSPAAAQHPLEIPEALQTALSSLRNGRYQETLRNSAALARDFPGHPLPSLIAAESLWGLIFCQTGHINSREVWNAADEKSTSYDADFFRAVEEALTASEDLRDDPDSAALGAFYEGLAYGVRTRLYTLRAEALDSGRAGKQMRAALLEAAALDEELRPDVEAGMGAYNYYADVLSPLIKIFRFFLLIPGGDRAHGLEQLQSAARNAVLLAPEARYELAKIYGLRENRPADAVPLFLRLAKAYPDNAIFALSGAIQAERIGEKALARDLARKAVEASQRMDDICQQRLEPASLEALQRLGGAIQ